MPRLIIYPFLLLLCVVCLSLSASAQSKVQVTRKITDIPNLYLTTGQELELTIDTSAVLQMKFTPEPIGNLTLDASNKLLFKPAAEDLGAIDIQLKTATDSFAFRIITLAYKETGSAFTPYKVGAALDNQNFYDVFVDSTEVNSKHLIIEGREIVFDGSASNPLTSLLFNKAELKYPYKKVSIIAEKVIVKKECLFPGVKLLIKTRDLIFDGQTGVPSIVTTPFKFFTPVMASAETDTGEQGDDADSLVLMVKNFSIRNLSKVTSPILFYARGGNGAPAPRGLNGSDYPKVELIQNFNIIPVNINEGTCGSHPDDPYIRSVSTGISNDPRSKALVHIWFRKQLPNSKEVHHGGRGEGGERTVSCTYTQFNQIDNYSKIFSESAIRNAKAKSGGIPGKGGKGGNIFSNVAIARYVTMRHGEDGVVDTIRRSGKIDGPANVWSYQTDNIDPANNAGFVLFSYPESKTIEPQKNAAPDMADGSIAIDASKQNDWKDIRFAKHAMHFANELFRFGYVDSAAAIYDRYLKDFFNTQYGTGTPEDSIVFAAMGAAARINQAKIKFNLDYYGNPQNWVPKLDLTINYAQYTRNLDNSFKTISHAIAFLKELKRNNNTIGKLNDLLGSMATSNTDYQASVDQIINNDIPELQNEMGKTQNYIDMITVELRRIEKEINSMAEGIIRDREKKAKKMAFLKTLTTIAKVIPVYQPALAAAATAVELLAFKEGGQSITDKISYVSDSYSELKATQQSLKDNLSAAWDKSKNTSGDLSFSAINKNKKEIFANLRPVIETMDNIIKKTQPSPMPADALEVEIQRLKESNSEYKAVIDSVKRLTELNKSIADKLIKLTGEVTELSLFMENNITAIAAIKTELVSVKPISKGTIDLIEEVKTQAMSNIMYYQYLFAKSYEYFTLKQYKGYEKTAPLLSALKGLEDKSNFADIYAAIKTLYTAEVDNTIEATLRGLNTGQQDIPSTQVQTINLSAADIARINNHDTLSINLLRTFAYNVLRERLNNFDDILIRDIFIMPQYDSAAQTALASEAFASSSVAVVHSGTSRRYLNEKKFSFYHQTGQDSKPQSWILNHDFVENNKETYRTVDKKYLELLCEYIKKENEAFCANKVADVAFDSDLLIYKTDNPSSIGNVNLKSLRIKATISAKSRLLPGKSVISFYNSSAGEHPVVKITVDGKMSQFAGFNYLLADRNKTLDIYCEPAYGGKKFTKWTTNIPGSTQILQNRFTVTLSAPNYYFIPVYE